MPNAELSEVLRFLLGLAGLVLTLGNCLFETISEYRLLRRERPDDQERLLVAFGWIRAAVARTLTCTMLAITGWLLMTQPPTSIAWTFEAIAVRWAWVVLGVYMVMQAFWARRDRARIRRIRREETTS